MTPMNGRKALLCGLIALMTITGPTGQQPSKTSARSQGWSGVARNRKPDITMCWESIDLQSGPIVVSKRQTRQVSMTSLEQQNCVQRCSTSCVRQGQNASVSASAAAIIRIQNLDLRSLPDQIR
ncbi:hypothetical protein Pst134EA_005092 [Puccinia striiformis f. sp. tritici]|uniref:Uncharacterized protein n=3 Tax=Puccinia striiformis TaxID=27350 RepID=A0A0L0VAP2_9BASI|nr:hypothetical protein Pst134EA_005092 [Puccinia striiformis f. sp. tritici]KNE96286.1 hypothetical protein PSTG_10405 [Puccinia striiformis f. sp. tritici PST-78]POW09843.1 hypothetical protein PSTT_06507 [Puccinia striiformis]KAH9462244.1 hypothetical protein Pst134EB_006151 [Puccinia striiformis f. sp. tritici]KAH9471184.1 hypothetical protein Pst134EA_005092 [Puccinia striiformis f. sp. tritici]POW21425.1 hypothetical protein PSHT_02427 [Puccinia striiformis]